MRKNILELLLESGLVNTQQIADCQKAIEGTQQRIQDCLIEKKIITPEALAQAYAKYASLEYVAQVTEQMADLTTLARVPMAFLRENVVMPVSIGGQPFILTANPLNFQPVDDLNLLLGGGIRAAVATPKTILDAINKYYPLEGAKQMIEELEEEQEGVPEVELGGIEERDIVAMAAEAPIIKLVNHILYQAVKREASDIHIEPFEKEVSVRYRVDGIMYTVMTPPKRIQGALTSRIKIMANLNIAEKRLPQDGRIDLRVAGKPIDIRVSVLPVAFGERIVMRLLDKTRTFGDIAQMGLSDRDLRILKDSIARPNGIIYVTGPTGSGKTTTLNSSGIMYWALEARSCSPISI